MVDSARNEAGWAQQWIEQQRALLEQMAQSGAGPAAGAGFGTSHLNALASQWGDLAKTYLSGLMQMAQSTVQGGDGSAGKFQPPGEMLDACKAAWSNALSQVSAPGGWSDLINRSPPLGLFREQTEAWRAVASAKADVERLEQELAAVLRRVQTEALSLLEERVKARAASDTPVQGFRDLYDLWVECSEQVFNTVAHSSAYAHLQGELGNASMRLRARMQKVIEQGLRQFDLPTRSEVNSVHQQLRALRQRLSVLEEGAASEPMPGPAAAPAKPAPTAKRKPVAQRAARKRSR